MLNSIVEGWTLKWNARVICPSPLTTNPKKQKPRVQLDLQLKFHLT